MWFPAMPVIIHDRIFKVKSCKPKVKQMYVVIFYILMELINEAGMLLKMLQFILWLKSRSLSLVQKYNFWVILLECIKQISADVNWEFQNYCLHCILFQHHSLWIYIIISLLCFPCSELDLKWETPLDLTVAPDCFFTFRHWP